MEKQLHVVVTLNPQPDDIAKLKNLVGRFSQLVQSNEPGTLLYRWFFSPDNIRCMVLETFVSEDAFMAHLKNVESLLPDLLAVAPITKWEIFGAVSAELTEGLRAFGAANGVMPQFYTYAGGLVRQEAPLSH